MKKYCIIYVLSMHLVIPCYSSELTEEKESKKRAVLEILISSAPEQSAKNNLNSSGPIPIAPKKSKWKVPNSLSPYYMSPNVQHSPSPTTYLLCLNYGSVYSDKFSNSFSPDAPPQ